MDVNEFIEKIKALRCPQCGSTEIDLDGINSAKCRHCGATILLEQPKTEVTNNITIVSDGVNVDAPIKYYKIEPEFDTKGFYKRALKTLCDDVSTPVDIFDSEFKEVNTKEIKIIRYTGVVHISYFASLGYERKETYTEYDSSRQQYVQKTRTVIDYKPTSGERSGEVTAIVPNGRKTEIDKTLQFFCGKSSLHQIGKYSSLEDNVFNKNLSHFDLTASLSIDFAKNIKQAGAFSVELSDSGKNMANEKMKSHFAYEIEKNLKSGEVKEVKNFTYTGYVDRITKVDCYFVPAYSMDYEYGESTYEVDGLAVEEGGVIYVAPNESEDIVDNVAKKTIVPIVLSTVFFILSMLVFMLVHSTAINIVAISVATSMFIASVIIRKTVENRIINGRQEEKKRQLSARLSEKGL